MSNLFDSIQKAAFKIITNTFGYDAKWQPSDGSDYQVAKVTLKEPTKQEEIGDIHYTPFVFISEYHKPDMPGLYEAVAAGRDEIITINEMDYYIRKVDAIWDGKTYKIILEQKV